MSEVSSRFSPKIKEKRWTKDLEKEILSIWEREKAARKLKPKENNTMIIDTPPPYPSGKWHIAAAAHYAQHDMISRFFKMLGYDVFIPFYADRNGLPVEVFVEKKYQINPHKMAESPEGRQKFIQLCRDELDKMERELIEVWRKLGCDFEYIREGTDSPRYRALTQATFIEMWKKGMIYKDKRPVNWCPRCLTALSEAEIEYDNEKGFLYYIEFPLEREGGKVTVATSRPELLYSCSALAYHPDDERYRHLEGKYAVTPLYNHKVIITPHPSVDPGFGTGIEMICSYGDWQDVRLFREMGLVPKVIINKFGQIDDRVGIIPKGTTVERAREIIAKKLEEKGYLVKKVSVDRSVPKCWRCKTTVEIIEEEEYFVRQLQYKGELLKLIDSIEFYPDFHKDRLVGWINSLNQDWPISRSRYYGTEIPVWRCMSCGSVLLPEPGKYYVPWKEPPPWDKCPKCGSPSEFLIGEVKVFDTWFDSSVSPLYVTNYLEDSERSKRLLRHVLRPQGYDIIRTWLYFTLLHVYLFLGYPAFRWVRVTGMGLDEKGEAMHKSKGNVIEPDPIIEEYGADPVRYWSAVAAKTGYDYKFNINLIRTGQLFVTKLWNIGRFISAFPDPGLDKVELEAIDKGMLEMLNRYARLYIDYFKKFDIQEPTLLVYQLAWDIFANNYIETIKARAYNDENKWSEEQQRAAWATLHYVFRELLKMIHPIMPFVTDALWRRLYGGRIADNILEVPRPDFEFKKEYLIEDLVHINSEVWKYKKERGLRLSDALPCKVYIPDRDLELIEYLKSLHKPIEISAQSTLPYGAHILGKTALECE